MTFLALNTQHQEINKDRSHIHYLFQKYRKFEIYKFMHDKFHRLSPFSQVPKHILQNDKSLNDIIVHRQKLQTQHKLILQLKLYMCSVCQYISLVKQVTSYCYTHGLVLALTTMLVFQWFENSTTFVNQSMKIQKHQHAKCCRQHYYSEISNTSRGWSRVFSRCKFSSVRRHFSFIYLHIVYYFLNTLLQ